MSSRTVRLMLGLTAIVLLLFAGRWTVSLIAEHWWALQFSPDAARFTTNWAVLSMLLELTGVLGACTWFVGHLLVVYRAIGSIQVHRRLGNLEIREAVNMRALVWGSVAGGLLLGLIVGRGAGDWTPVVLTAWSGLQYGQADPLLGRDLGYYLTRLPALDLLFGYAMRLTVIGLIGVLGLYVFIGALRWGDRRLAINEHARRHTGALAALLALLLAWRFVMQPALLVATQDGGLSAGLLAYHRDSAMVLCGMALAVAVLSGVWAMRGRDARLLAIWGAFALATLVARVVVPSIMGSGRGVLQLATRRQLDQLAYGLTALRDSSLTVPRGELDPLRPVGLWTAGTAVEATPDSGRVASADRAVLGPGHAPIPVWLVVRDQGENGAVINVLRDDRTGLGGRPLVIHEVDSLSSTPVALPVHLPLRGLWPRGPISVIDTAPGGVRIGSGLRRLVLAWALQSARLLTPGLTGHERVFWHLDPAERMSQLCPFAEWGAPSPRVIGGSLVWIVDGYLRGELFPSSTRIRWRGEAMGTVRAAFVSVVDARTGDTRIYLRHTAGELAKVWQGLTDSLIKPPSAMPAEVVRALPYPGDLLEVQLRVLEHPHWGLGRLTGGRAAPVGITGPVAEAIWETDTSGVRVVVPYLHREQRWITGVVRAREADGWETLTIVRIDSLLALPDPDVLKAKWSRFPTYQQLVDSVRRDGAEIRDEPARFWLTPLGLGAYQASFAHRAGQEPTLAWVSLALADRRGAGHDPEEAWQNLLGLSAPIISTGVPSARLAEARRALEAADRALKAGDLEAFGRAWDRLRHILAP